MRGANISYQRILNSKWRRNQGNRKSLLEQHSDNKQDPLKLVGETKEKQNLHSFKVSHHYINYYGGLNICPQILW